MKKYILFSPSGEYGEIESVKIITKSGKEMTTEFSNVQTLETLSKELDEKAELIERLNKKLDKKFEAWSDIVKRLSKLF